MFVRRITRKRGNNGSECVEESMMAKHKHNLGELVAWAKAGAVDLRNYDERAAWYGKKVKGYQDDWPFLSHHPEFDSTANEGEWELYFRDHLGGFSNSYRLFRDGIMKYY